MVNTERKPWRLMVGVICTVLIGAAIAFIASHDLTERKQGKLALDTVPGAANVFLDGDSRGRTPLVLEDVAPGDRHLRIERQGYETERLIVSVKSGVQESLPLIHLVQVKKLSPTPPVPLSVSGSTRERLPLSVAMPPPAVSQRLLSTTRNRTTVKSKSKRDRSLWNVGPGRTGLT
jgi:PEGA domain